MISDISMRSSAPENKNIFKNSDVDVLVVTSLAEIEEGRLLVRAELGRILSPYSPIELHIATPEQFAQYLQFLDVYVEV
jgi:predicted nucleotidyltransferase